MFFYTDDDGELVALRKGDYKYVYAEQRKPGTMGVWAEPFTTLRFQKIYNIFLDPSKHPDITSNTYWDWLIDPSERCTERWTRSESSPRRSGSSPRAIPPSFDPTTIMEETIEDIRDTPEEGQVAANRRVVQGLHD